MSDSFDPYRVWLGIPPAEQPPNHYRLLGVGLFESDPDVIESAADRQMAHVQTRKTGKHGSLTQQLLNELAAARLVLLNKDKKAAYDKELKEKSPAAKAQAPTASAKAIPKAQAISSSAAPAAPPVAGGASTSNSPRAIAQPLAVAQAEGAGVAEGGFALSSGRGSAAIRSRRRRSKVTPYAILGGVGLGVIVLIAVLNSGSKPDKVADGRNGDNNVRPNNNGGIKNTSGTPSNNSSNSSSSGNPATNNPSNSGGNTPANAGNNSEATPQPENGGTRDETPDETSGSATVDEGDEPATSTEEVASEPITVDEGDNQETTTVDNPPANDPAAPKTYVKFLRRPLAGRLDLKELDSIIDLEAGEFPQANFLASDEAEKPPSEKEQAEALKLVKEVYETEYASATTPQDKLALAARLYEKAAEDAGDSAARFALLSQARDLAAEAGNLSCALKAIDALDTLYELDATAQKTQLLKAAAQDMRAGANGKSLAANALKQVDGAIQANDLAGAEELRVLGEAAAHKARDARLTKLAGRIDEELQSIADQFTQFEQAAAIRKESPKDPSACLTMGKFYCFVAGDWQKGLPFFSVVEDEALKAAAAKDQLRPDEPDQQAEAGDAWWSLVETADDADKTAIRVRAAHWYNLAVEQLTGLAQEKVRNRLASLEQTPVAVASGGELPKFAKDFIGRYYLRATNKSKDVTQTILEFAENGEVTENNQAVAHWDVDEGTRIRITFPDTGDQPVYFKPRSNGGTISASRSSQGETWRWQLTRLFVVSVWKHETEEPRFGRPGRDRDRRRTEETLTFYSNGRVNDPLGNILWTLQGRNLLIDWGDNKRTAAVLNAAGNAYTGKTSQPTGIGSIKIDLNVEGKLIGKE